jgi:hypothetical protein
MTLACGDVAAVKCKQSHEMRTYSEAQGKGVNRKGLIIVKGGRVRLRKSSKGESTCAGPCFLDDQLEVELAVWFPNNKYVLEGNHTSTGHRTDNVSVDAEQKEEHLLLDESVRSRSE